MARALIATEKEEFVLHDRPTNNSSVLAPLQGVACGREKVPRIKNSIPHKFERIAVIFVGARLRHGIDHCSRVESVLRRHGARLYLELLQSIWEWQWQVQVVLNIIVNGSIQQIRDTIR